MESIESQDISDKRFHHFLSRSRREDTLAHWRYYIRTRVRRDKTLVLKRISEYIPLPKDLSKADLLSGDVTANRRWRTMIGDFWTANNQLERAMKDDPSKSKSSLWDGVLSGDLVP
jgi:hypothetical protein